MPHPTVVLLWWSAFFWAANVRQQRYILKACATVMGDSAFWARMSEYGVTGGSLGSSDDLTKYGGGVTSLTEDSIRAKLSSWFAASGVVPNSDTIYIVMLPAGISSQYDTTNGFIGHHQTYRHLRAPVYYGVIEYSPDVRQLMSVLTHEVCEAATDPDLTTGYYDRVNPSKPEIGDPCNLQITMMDGVPIQKVWSQEGCRCI